MRGEECNIDYRTRRLHLDVSPEYEYIRTCKWRVTYHPGFKPFRDNELKGKLRVWSWRWSSFFFIRFVLSFRAVSHEGLDFCQRPRMRMKSLDPFESRIPFRYRLLVCGASSVAVVKFRWLRQQFRRGHPPSSSSLNSASRERGSRARFAGIYLKLCVSPLIELRSFVDFIP